MSQELGTYDNIPLKDVLSGVRIRLEMRDTTQDDMLLKDLIIEVLKRMRSPNMFIRAQAYVDIEHFEAVVPTGFIGFEHYDPIRFVGSDGSTDANNWYGPQYVNDTYFKCNPDSNYSYITTGRVTEDNGKLFFSEDITATRAYLSYRSTNFDADGDLMIRADMESPLMSGTLWQYYLIKSASKPNLLALADRYERQFKQNKKAIKGIQNLPSSLERKLNHIIMNSI